MIGTSLCHYRITEKLGQGGMAEVYRAEDTNLSRQVAIKVLPDDFDLIHAPGMAKGQTYPPPPPGSSGSRLLLNSFQRLDSNLRWDSANALGAL